MQHNRVPNSLLSSLVSTSPRTHHSPPLDSAETLFWASLTSEVCAACLYTVVIYSRVMYLPWLVAMKTWRSGNAKKKAHVEICPFSLCSVWDIVNSSIYHWWSGWIAFEAFSNALALRHRNPWGSSCWSHCADTAGSSKLVRFRKFLISHRSRSPIIFKD